MKLLMVSAMCACLVPLSGAQNQNRQAKPTQAQTAHPQPKQDALPEATLDFKPVDDALPLSSMYVFVGRPVCDADGDFYFNGISLPKGEKQVVAVSSTGKVTDYNLASVSGLVNLVSHAIDAKGSDIYLLVEGAKRDDLIDHDVNPNSPEVREYTKCFVVHFKDDTSAPEIIPLDLPFLPMQFAATSDGKFIFLGLNRINRTPVLATVNDFGEVEHYFDAYQDMGTDESILANAPHGLKSQVQKMPQGAPLGFALLSAQFIHFRDSLLLLMPGSRPKILTIRGGGALEITSLHLPVGLEADSLIPSNAGWLIRATDARADGEQLIVVVNPSDGKALRVVHSSNMNISAITCAHDGDYYAIHWPRGDKENEKAVLMKAGQ